MSAHCCGIRSHAMSLRTNARGHVGLGATQDLFYAAIGLTSQQPAVADAVRQVTAATRWMHLAAQGLPCWRRPQCPAFPRPCRTRQALRAYLRLKAYYARALGRPAWQRTLSLHSERLGVTVTDIR